MCVCVVCVCVCVFSHSCRTHGYWLSLCLVYVSDYVDDSTALIASMEVYNDSMTNMY